MALKLINYIKLLKGRRKDIVIHLAKKSIYYLPIKSLEDYKKEYKGCILEHSRKVFVTFIKMLLDKSKNEALLNLGNEQLKELAAIIIKNEIVCVTFNNNLINIISRNNKVFSFKYNSYEKYDIKNFHLRFENDLGQSSLYECQRLDIPADLLKSLATERRKAERRKARIVGGNGFVFGTKNAPQKVPRFCGKNKSIIKGKSQKWL